MNLSLFFASLLFVVVLFATTTAMKIHGQVFPNQDQQDYATFLNLQANLKVPEWPPTALSIPGCTGNDARIHQDMAFSRALYAMPETPAQEVAYFLGNFSSSFPNFDSTCLLQYWASVKDSTTADFCSGAPVTTKSSGTTENPLSSILSSAISSVMESIIESLAESSQHPPTPSGDSSDGEGSHHSGSGDNSMSDFPGSGSGDHSSDPKFTFPPHGGSDSMPSFENREAEELAVPACVPFGAQAQCMMFRRDLLRLSIYNTIMKRSPYCYCRQVLQSSSSTNGGWYCATTMFVSTTSAQPPTTTAPPQTTAKVTSMVMTTQQQIQPTTSDGKIQTTQEQQQQTSGATPSTTDIVVPPGPSTTAGAPGTTSASNAAAPTTTKATVSGPTTSKPATSRPGTTTTVRPQTTSSRINQVPTTSTTKARVETSTFVSGQQQQSTTASGGPIQSTTAATTTTTPPPTRPPTSVEAILSNPSSFNAQNAINQIAEALAISDKSSVGIKMMNATAVEVSFTGPNAALNVQAFLRLNSTVLSSMEIASAHAAPGEVITTSAPEETSDGKSNVAMIAVVIIVVVVVLVGGYFAYTKRDKLFKGSGGSSTERGGVAQAFNLDYDEDVMLGNGGYGFDNGNAISGDEMMKL